MASLEERSPAGARRVRNQNNRAEIHLRNQLTDLNREVSLRLQMIEMECLDWKSFLKDLKSCNSDDLSEFAPLFLDDEEEPTKGMRTRLSQLFTAATLGIDKTPELLDYTQIKTAADHARNILSELDLPRTKSLPEYRVKRFLGKKSKSLPGTRATTTTIEPIPEEEPQAETQQIPVEPAAVEKSSALITRINTDGPEVAPGRTVSLARAQMMPSNRVAAAAAVSSSREDSKPFPAIVSPKPDPQAKESHPGGAEGAETTLPQIGNNADTTRVRFQGGSQTERGTVAYRRSNTRRRKPRRKSAGFMRTLLDSNAERFKGDWQPLETRIQDFYAKIDPLIIKPEKPELLLPPLVATQES